MPTALTRNPLLLVNGAFCPLELLVFPWMSCFVTNYPQRKTSLWIDVLLWLVMVSHIFLKVAAVPKVELAIPIHLVDCLASGTSKATATVVCPSVEAAPDEISPVCCC